MSQDAPLHATNILLKATHILSKSNDQNRVIIIMNTNFNIEELSTSFLIILVATSTSTLFNLSLSFNFCNALFD